MLAELPMETIEGRIPSDRRVTQIDPVTLTPICQQNCATEEQAMAAVATAARGQQHWHERGLESRLSLLRALTRLLCARQSTLSDLLARESGRPIQECLGADILPTVNALARLASMAPRLLKPVKNISYIAYGVVGVIGTWNYPVFLNVVTIAQALAAGNTVVWKPSELAMLSAQSVEQLFREAGIGPDLLQVLYGDGETGRGLVRGGCNLVVFTGGEYVGRKIMAELAVTGTPSIMELSGNDAFIVDASANLQAAAKHAVWARVSNAGQSCISPQRFYVHRSVASTFTDAVKSEIESLQPADMTPLRTHAQLLRCLFAVDASILGGATCITGGRRAEGSRGWFFEPTLLTGCTDDMPVMEEDLFGPILPICEVQSLEEAIKRANASRFGLSASVWTEDKQAAKMAAGALQCGIVSINGVLLDAANPNCSFGGVRASGFGKLRGPEGLKSMVITRQVYVHRADASARHLYPYCPSGPDILSSMVAFKGKFSFRAIANLTRSCIHWASERKSISRTREGIV